MKQLFAGVFCALAFLPLVHADSITFDDILSASFSKNPDLKSSDLQVKILEESSNQLDGSLDTRYGGSIGISNEKVPTTNAFSANETGVAYISGQVTQPFTDGSSLIGTVKYNRTELVYPGTTSVAFQASPNPWYQHQIDVMYRYPLAAGAGNPSYTYQKEASEADQHAAQLRLGVIKEQLAAQGIGLYAQFVLNDLSVAVSKDAVFRAQELLNNQKKRENFGLVEKEERYQTEALLAGRKLQLAQSVAAKKAAQTALNRYMYQDADTALETEFTAPKVFINTTANMLMRAEKKRPIFDVLDAQYAAAESRLEMAKSAGDYQLDLVGKLGTRALDGSAGTAFAQGFTVDERYIGVSLDFSDVWDNKANKAAVEKGLLQLESIDTERQKAHLDLESEIAKLTDALRSSDIMLKASSRQVQAETKKYRAEVERYKKGRTPTSVIIQFEGDLRASELRFLIQKVNKGVSEYQLALAMGELAGLAEYKARDVDRRGGSFNE